VPLIALVGMPGSGKTTVGRHLARQLGQRFVDTDHEIERRVCMPVRAFFDSEGEAAFRDLEEQVLDELSKQTGTVLATGGGAVLRERNREILRERRRVIYLRATAEELYRRLKHDTRRPLLQVGDPLQRLRELYRQRDLLYRQTAHHVVEAARPTVGTLVNMVRMQLELSGEWDAPAGGAS
jgi:shikimate kinase